DAALRPLPRGHRAAPRRRACISVLLHARGTRCDARRGPGARRETALRRPLPRRRPRAGGRRGDRAFQDAARGRDGRRRSRQGADRLRQRRARRSRHRTLGRHADVQLHGRRRRHGYADHARHPRRRPREQHASADQHLPRARRRAAGVRASADDPRSGRDEAVEAARRRQRARVPADGLSAERDAELPRAPRLVARRSGDLHARRADPALRSRPGQPLGRELRSDEAAVGQPAAHPEDPDGGARAAPRRAARAPRARSRRRASARAHGRSAARAQSDDGRDGRARALLLPGVRGVRREGGGETPRACRARGSRGAEGGARRRARLVREAARGRRRGRRGAAGLEARQGRAAAARRRDRAGRVPGHRHDARARRTRADARAHRPGARAHRGLRPESGRRGPEARYDTTRRSAIPNPGASMKVDLIAAARPNFMKVAPLYHELAAKDWCTPRIVHTGQHYDPNMSDAFFADLGMPRPHVHLGVGSGSHAEQTGRVMIEYEKVCLAGRPDWIVVVGDVNSTLACALVGAKLVIPVAHLEAGLRSGDRTMPEVINRIVTDSIADLLWTPSPDGDEHLRAAGVPADMIERVGNIMIDSFELLRPKIEAAGTAAKLGLEPRGYGVVTLHRPSNVDTPERLELIVDRLAEVAERLPLVFPVHPRTRRKLDEFGLAERLGRASAIRLVEPLSYIEFMSAVVDCRLAITDSGGIQEETSYLGIP